MKNRRVFGGAEVSVGQTPIANRFGDARDELPHASFALRRADFSVQIFRGHDVGGRHGPIFGDLNVLLLEDGRALRVGDERGAQLPLHFVVWRHSRPGEKALEREPRRLLLVTLGSGARGAGCGQRLGHSQFYVLCAVLFCRLFGGFISEGGHRSFSLLDVQQLTRNQPLSPNFCVARTPSSAASSSFYPLPKHAVILSEGGLPPAFSRAGHPSRRILFLVILQSL